MPPIVLLLRLALGTLRRQWPGALALLAGTLVATAALAAVPVYDAVLRDLALREALESADPADLQVRVAGAGLALDRTAYSDAQAALDGAVAAALGGASGSQVRMGTSETLALFEAADPATELLEPGPRLGEAALRFRSELDQHVTIVAGRAPEALPRGLGDPIPVLVGEGTAAVLQLEPGQLLELRPDASGGPPLPLEVAGVARATDPAARYWGGAGGAPATLDRAGEAFALLVPEATFFGAAADLLSGVDASFESDYAVRAAAVEAGDVQALAQRVGELPRDLEALGGARVESGLLTVLAGVGGVPGLDRTVLALLLGQLTAAALVFVAALSARLAAARSPRHEALVLSGASPAQLVALEALAVLPVALAGLLLGPPLAAGTVAALGGLEAFEPFTNGGWLAFELSPAAFAYGAVAAGAAFMVTLAAAVRPALRAASPSQPRGSPVRGGAAALTALAAAAGVAFWALTRQEQLFGGPGAAIETRYALLLAPAALLVPAALAGWWLLPRVARPLAWLVAATRSVVLLDALRALARRPIGVSFALVAVAAAAAAVVSALPGALERSPDERAAHRAGADLRASELRGLDGAAEPAFRDEVAAVPAAAASPAVRIAASLTRPGEAGAGAVAIELLGVDPATFGAVAAFRDDFAPQPLDGMLAALATNATALDGLAVPRGARQLGAWVQLPELAGEASVMLALRDGEGRVLQLLLGCVEPGALAQWGFLAADLATPLGFDGAPLDGASLEGTGLIEPLTIQAYYVRLDADAAAAAGSLVLGPLLATTDAPLGPLDAASLLLPRGSAFERRAILHDLVDIAGFEPIADLAAADPAQAVRGSSSAPPDFDGASRLDWAATPSGATAPAVRGIRQETDGAPALLYASHDALARLGAGSGDDLQLEVAGRFLRAQVAGPLDHFPTLGAGGGAFAVAGLDRLLAAVNASPGDAALRSNEAWFASGDAATTARALALGERGLDAAGVVDRRAELAALRDARTLALGWRGLLTLALAGVLTLAALAILVDGLAAARAARRDEAIVEALGAAGASALAAVLAALLMRVTAAAALGLAAGIVLGRWLLDILAADGLGETIVPPPRLDAAVGPWWLLAAALVAAFVVVVVAATLRYRGLAWQRALALEEA